MIVPAKFAVNQSGGATYTIPIALPPGTAGMTPNLSLDYSSQGSDGIVGLGWTLSGLPSIGRCPQTIAQEGLHGGVNFNGNDRFCMEGQKLFLISGSYGQDGSEYRTELDGFSRIIAHGSTGTGPAWFEVHTKSGQTMQFGNTADSQLTAIQAFPTTSGGSTTYANVTVVRSWAVNRISDTKGNYLTVTYTNDTADGQAYPTRVDYTGNANTGLATYNSVQFVYNTARPDVTPTYQAGALSKTTVLLTDVETYAGSNLVHDYRIGYRLGSATTHSRVTSITLCDGSGTCLAPTTFTWQGGSPTAQVTPFTGFPVTQSSSNMPNVQLGDFNADGVNDWIFQFDPQGTGCPAGGSIYLGSYVNGELTLTPSGMTMSYTNPVYPNYDCNGPADFYTTYFPGSVDPNADGSADVFVRDRSDGSNDWYLLQNNKAGALNQVGPALWKFTLAGDFSGDGRTDWLQQNDGNNTTWAWFSNGDGTFTKAQQYIGNGGLYSSSTILGGIDFDGDGCTDLFAQGNATQVVFSCNPLTPYIHIPQITNTSGRTLYGDFNGDGKTDVLYIDGSSAKLYLSTGTGFAPVIANPAITYACKWWAGDVNGDGKTDIIAQNCPVNGTESAEVWLSTGSGFVQGPSIPCRQLGTCGASSVSANIGDFTSVGAASLLLQIPNSDVLVTFGYVPEVVTGFSNGVGATTTVTYDRLNKNGALYAKGTSAAYPAEDVDGPIYVVSRVDSSNGIGGTYSSSYAYAGLQSDLSGRGFLGFTSVSSTDLQTNVTTTTTYATAFPYTGMMLSQTQTGCSGITLNSTANTYATVTGASGRPFVALTKSVVTSNDCNGAAMPTTTTSYLQSDGVTPAYDGYGNPTLITVTMSDGSSKTTANTYTNDTTNWFLGRLTQSVVTSVVGTSTVTRTSSFAYDPTTGLLTQEVVEPNDCEHRLETDYTYDSFGNKTAKTVSGAGCSSDNYKTAIATRTTQTGFDSAGEFAISATNALSQSESWGFAGNGTYFGLPTSHTGPNNLTTTWTYDTFGRKTLETRPDGTKTVTSYAYCSGVNGGTESCPTNGAYLAQVEAFAADGVTQIGPIGIAYYDSLSRALGSDVQGFDGSTIRTSTQYDSFGRVAQTSRPYFLAGGTPQWTVNHYDTLGRVTEADYPNGGKVTNTYNGLTTSSTNALNQTTTTTKNAEGLKASVTDANGKTWTYLYDANGNMTSMTDAVGHILTYIYDVRGNKTDSLDPDMGHWTYVYDVLGELIGQTDANLQTTALAYDVLGHVVSRTESNLVSTWIYGTSASAHNVGKLIEAKACTSAGCSTVVADRTFTFDADGRPSTNTLNIDGSGYSYTSAYNTTNGQLSQVTYPSGFVAQYIYTALGYLCRLTDNSGSPTCTSSGGANVYWTANTRDAELHLTSQTAGNNVSATQTFDATTGLLTNVRAGTNNAVAQFDYTFDSIGNLTYRADDLNGVFERFCYTEGGTNVLNRLTAAAVGNGVDPGANCAGGTVTTVAYDAIGNITSKSDVGTYSYPYDKVHAVQSITGTVNGVTNPTFTYDANGNMTEGDGRTVTYTAFNMVASITEGTNVVSLTYDSEHTRVKQCLGATCGSITYYLNDAASGAMSEKAVAGSTTTWRDYLKADGKIIAERFAVVGGSTSFVYFVLDHLGSVAVVTDASGNVTERDSYDPWGRRRNIDGSTNPTCSIVSATTRGFTNQEEMDSVCLVNLNARIYDPTIGKFLSADPVIGDSYVGQEWNHYAYVINNPLSLTDPTGLCFLGCFWKSPIFREVVGLAVAIVLANPEFGLAAMLEESGAFATSALGIVVNGGIIGGISGAISSGTLKGAELGILQGALFAEAGNILGSTSGGSTDLLSAHTLEVFVAHGLVGGIVSTVGGGKFGAGFLSGAVSSLGPQPVDGQDFEATAIGTAESAVLGGAGSVLGGGKFENGAITGAFGYLFNEYSHTQHAPREQPLGHPDWVLLLPLGIYDAGAALVDGLFEGSADIAEAAAANEAAASPGTRMVVSSSGETTIEVNGVQMSTHAAEQATARGISMDEVSDAMSHGYSFKYLQGGKMLTGYYDSNTNVFVGVGDRVTTVLQPSNPANYLRNLQSRGP